MKKSVIALSALVVVSSLIGCAGRKGLEGYQSTVPEEIEAAIKKECVGSVYAVGSAEATTADIAVRKAEMQARAALAREFTARLDQLQKSYEESVNKNTLEEYSQVMQLFSSVELENVKLIRSLSKKIDGGMVSGKVLVAVSENDFRNSVESRLGSYTSFRASKAYEELQAKVDASTEN